MTSPQEKGRKFERQLKEGEISIPLSGAGFFKEDKKDSEFLIQCKLTTAKSYTLKLEDLLALQRNAAAVDRTPKFELGFEVAGRIRKYILIPEEVFDRFVI